MTAANLLSTVIIVGIMVLVPVYYYVLKRSVNIVATTKWKSIQLSYENDLSEVVKALYPASNIIIKEFSNDVVCFQDYPTLVSWGNIYFAHYDNATKKLVILFRGSLFNSIVDYSALNRITYLIQANAS